MDGEDDSVKREFMEKEPKSIWKRPWKGRRAVVFWLLIVPIAAFLTAWLLALVASICTPPFFRTHPGFGNYVECVLAITLTLIIAIALVFAIGNFILWLFHWRNLKRVLFVTACIATVIALSYAEEDWRGKHDWEKFKRQLEAKGENFDAQSVVPPAVPDDQNFAMSPVWIAEIKYSVGSDSHNTAEAWYGDRIYSEEVSNYFRLLPMWVSDVVGTNWAWHLPDPPDAMGNWRIGQTTDLKPWQSFYRNLEESNSSADIAITPQAQTPAQDVLLALSKYDPLIERLRRDSQLPYSRFPIGYHPEDAAAMAATLLPHLGSVKPWAMVLRLRAIAELQNGESDKALEDVNLIFRLADASRVEPFMISQLIRAAVLQIALQPIYEGLADGEWSDRQLAELDSGLSKVDLLGAYQLSMHRDLIFQQSVADYLRRHPGEIANMSSDSGDDPKPPGPFVMTLIPGGWFYQNELRCVRGAEDYCLPAVDASGGLLSPSSIRRAEAAIETETRHVNAYNMLERMLLPSLLKPAITFAYDQNSVNLARVAIALERFRLAHGQYPDSLDSLSPQFIASLPHDITNGQPLHYQKTEDDQFVLYSVGWNETDDGGVVKLTNESEYSGEGSTPGVNRKQGDWVWKYPEK